MPACAVCQENATARCSGCQDVYYCGREHQAEAWPAHKIDCKRIQKEKAGIARPPQGPEHLSSKPQSGVSLADDYYYDCATVHAAYGRLIDAYRMRVEDECTFRGEIDEESLYGGNTSNPIWHFRKFIADAERRNKQLTEDGKRGVLPGWWDSKTDIPAIEKMALTDKWFNIKYAVEKSDIQEHYKNSLMPMQLRFLAEEIWGSLYSGF